MREHLERQRSWLTVDRLPGYAPDLNPAEGLWANLKGTELANRCDLEIADTVAAAEHGISRGRYGGRHQPRPQQPTAPLRLPQPERSFFMTNLSLSLCEVLCYGRLAQAIGEGRPRRNR